MAASDIFVFDRALPKILGGTISFGSSLHSFRLVLVGANEPLSTAFDGASGNCQYSDLQYEFPTGSGYTAGGEELLGLSLALNIGPPAKAVVDAQDVTWASLTLTDIYAGVIVDWDAANKDLLGYFILNESVSPPLISVAGGDLSVTWNAAGIAYLQRAV